MLAYLCAKIPPMKLSLLSLLAFLLLSCSNPRPEMEGDFYADDIESVSELKEISPTEQSAPVNNTNQEEIVKKVIKSGSISFQSENIKKDYDRIKALLSAYDSYIDNENETNTGYQIRFDVSIRVASKSFDSLFNKLSLLSTKVDFKSSNIEDVTERYYDLKTRIKNKRSLEEKYLLLLKRASSIKDVLEIERSLNEIRTEIETAEGSFRYLSKQVSYSTIQLSFYEMLPDAYEPDGFWSRVSSAVGSGWQEFLSFLVVLAQGWPFIILLTLGIYIFRKIRAFRLNKKQD